MQDAKSQEKQLSHGYAKWYSARKATGRDGWRTMTQLFLASAHSCAKVLFSEIAGVLFFKHFSWKAAFFSPVGVSHIPTAGWHTGWCLEEAVYLFSVQADLGYL